MRHPTPGSYLRVIALAFEMALKQVVTDSFVIFGVLIQPLLIAVLAIFILQERSGDYAIFVVVGSGMTGLWTSLLFISGRSVTEERWTGTLEHLVGMPTPLPLVIFGKNLAYVLQSLGSMIVSYMLATWIFGFSLHIDQPILFAISLFFTILSFVCFGLVIAAFFVLNPDIQRWQNGLEYPIYLLSGFLFPITLLPGWTTPLSYLLAPYWAAQALHSTSSGGAVLGQLIEWWGWMILFGIFYLIIARHLFRRLLHRARVDASLGMR